MTYFYWDVTSCWVVRSVLSAVGRPISYTLHWNAAVANWVFTVIKAFIIILFFYYQTTKTSDWSWLSSLVLLKKTFLSTSNMATAGAVFCWDICKVTFFFFSSKLNDYTLMNEFKNPALFHLFVRITKVHMKCQTKCSELIHIVEF